MLDQDFINRLELAILKQKPGREAQILMANPGRSMAEPIHARSASVLLLLVLKNASPHIVLTKRTAKYPDDKHSGQISFPGGSLDPTDANLQMTAIRETYEEIGVEPEKLQIIGYLTNLYIPVSNFLVHPFVGYLRQEAIYKIQPDEVDEIIEVPVSMLMDDNNIKKKNIRIFNGITLKDVPYFDFYGNTVWGATAMILSEFRQLVSNIQGK